MPTGIPSMGESGSPAAQRALLASAAARARSRFRWANALHHRLALVDGREAALKEIPRRVVARPEPAGGIVKRQGLVRSRVVTRRCGLRHHEPSPARTLALPPQGAKLPGPGETHAEPAGYLPTEPIPRDGAARGPPR